MAPKTAANKVPGLNFDDELCAKIAEARAHGDGDVVYDEATYKACVEWHSAMALPDVTVTQLREHMRQWTFLMHEFGASASICYEHAISTTDPVFVTGSHKVQVGFLGGTEVRLRRLAAAAEYF